MTTLKNTAIALRKTAYEAAADHVLGVAPLAANR
jgi:hypothetical protein